MLHSVALLPFVLSGILAQSLSPPPTWQNTTVNQTYNEQVNIADEALSETVSNYNPDIGNFNNDRTDTGFTPGVFLYEMARFDQLTGQNKYKGDVDIDFTAIQQKNLTLSFKTIYGYAAIYAHQAYQNDSYLQFAEDCWLVGFRFTVSQAQPAILKNSTYQSQCSGSTMDGGSFRTNSTSDSYINVASTGLSSLLAEATSNETYLNAAKQSADFIHSHLTNANGLIMDGIFADTCDQGSEQQGAKLSSANSGVTIEGLAILNSMTQNTTMQQWMENVVSKTLQYSWNDDNGILNDNSHFNIIAGLVTAFERTNSSDLQGLISKYLAVQYNAVLFNAAINGTNSYGDGWTKPQLKSSSSGQISALSILVNAMALDQEKSPPSPSNTSETSPSQSSSADNVKKTNVGAIVGGVIGSLGLIALTLLFLLCFRSWRRHHSRSLRHPSAIFIPPPTFSNSTQHTDQNDLESSNDTSSPVTTSQNPSSYFSVSEKRSRRTGLPNLPNGETPRTPEPQANVDQHNAPSEMEARRVPTDELVRILAQRLQQAETQHGDSPPAYNAN
ncbi:hypothetical protein VKT23_004966 [Stygiomarasmius scandens]|uniref:Glycoside hydrolase family 76 protein n=1 Tax=Marasmiellus scandens TaxID=2682957 RepID=A0ABR1JRR4_9AGAR